jgi:hypothetical protein
LIPSRLLITPLVWCKLQLDSTTPRIPPTYLIDFYFAMAISNVGSLVLNLLIFVTTLVNFSYALTSVDTSIIILLYAISKIFLTAPEEGIFNKCHQKHLYQAG